MRRRQFLSGTTNALFTNLHTVQFQEANAAQAVAGDRISVRDFGAVGDGVTDDTAALIQARDFAAAAEHAPTLVWPDGVYMISASPNWAIDRLSMEFGDVTLRHMDGASGYVMLIDSPSGGHTWDMKFRGQPKLDCASSSEGPILVRGIHHSDLNWRVLGSPTDCGIVEFAVLTKFRVVASANQAVFTIAPKDGLILKERAPGEYVADCSFELILEGLPRGLFIEKAQGCYFKGTSEANDRGVEDTAACIDNVFQSFWCEANATVDLELYGIRNTFIGCRMQSASARLNVQLVTASGTQFIGGFMRVVNCHPESSDTMLMGTSVSDHPSLGVIGTDYKAIGCSKVGIDGELSEKLPDRVGEAGEFVPTLGGEAPPDARYSTQLGAFTRQGSVCHFNMEIALSSLSGGRGGATIEGLPFPARSGPANSVSVGSYSSITLADGRYTLHAEIPAGQSHVVLYASGAASPAPRKRVNLSDFSSQATLNLSGTYLVD